MILSINGNKVNVPVMLYQISVWNNEDDTIQVFISENIQTVLSDAYEYYQEVFTEYEQAEVLEDDQKLLSWREFIEIIMTDKEFFIQGRDFHETFVYLQLNL